MFPALVIRTGVGYHIYDHEWDTVRAMTFELESKLYFAYETLYTVDTGLAKISTLLFYLRVFPTKSMQRSSWLAIGCITILTVTFFLISFLACRPFSANWTYELRNNEHCMDRKPSFIVSCVFTILTDFLVLGLPLRPIWGLKMEKKIKLGLICVFASGIIVTVFSFIRLYFVVAIDYAFDFPYTGVPAMFFTTLEPCLMVMCISLPMLYTLFPKRSDKNNSSYANKPRTAGPLYTFGRGRNSRFTPIEESRLTNYDMNVLPTKKDSRESLDLSHEAITVQETFTVQEEAARPGEALSGPNPALVKPYSAVAWSEGRYQG
uniref:Rhodopsin domain-containing protein n=1 Tax=Hypomontagnella monticulosa TaxID=2487000 RepID=A0A7S6TZD8_9PEZI|nr:hypothetical protein HMg6350.t1 [Hypomontagnella monticulosa]